MKLSEFLEQTWKHITLYQQITKAGQTLVVPEINIDLTVGMISTASKEEFQKLCFNYVPVGTVIDTIDDEYYETKLLAVRNYLTRRLLTDKNARYYLDILERRDKDRWSKEQKSMKVEQGDNKLSITFKGME